MALISSAFTRVLRLFLLGVIGLRLICLNVSLLDVCLSRHKLVIYEPPTILLVNFSQCSDFLFPYFSSSSTMATQDMANISLLGSICLRCAKRLDETGPNTYQKEDHVKCSYCSSPHKPCLPVGVEVALFLVIADGLGSQPCPTRAQCFTKVAAAAC